MREKLNIVHCLRAPVGGLFRHVCDLAAAQAMAGHHVGILCDASFGGRYADDALNKLLPVCDLGVEQISMSRMPGFGDFKVALWTGRMASRWQADILHGHGAKGGAYARLAPVSGTRVKRFYTPHGGSLHYSRDTLTGRIFLAFERMLARRTDGLIFESAYGRRVYEEKIGVPACPARVIHNGLRPEEFTPVATAANAADIVFVGELRALKGVAVLLEAMALLAGRGQAMRAVIVGDGPERGAFERLAGKLGLSDMVTFAGIMPARQAFALGHVLAVPSLAESFPYIVLEAVAARMPMIATDVGGIGEIFAANSDRLIPAGDARALANAIASARNDPQAAARTALTLSHHAKSAFSVHTMAERIEAFYRAPG